ncbi:MAG TPA: choice-of-anchor Q domain-containing protein, partial [Verrucomicrobiae bacterium]
TGGLTSGVNNNYVGVNANAAGLLPLAYNGGSTMTMALLDSSPLINLGLAADGLSSDQRGVTYSGAPDIGAWEAVSMAPFFNSGVSAQFVTGLSSNYSITAAGFPTPAIRVQGALPSGFQLDTSGYLYGTPAAGTEGIYPLTLTASNGIGSTATETFTIYVRSQSSFGLTVNTLTDDGNAYNSLLSLREAITNAASLGGSQTITFAPSLFTNGPGILLLTNAPTNYKPMIMPTANSKLVINGPGPNLLMISWGGYSPIVNSGGPNIEFDNLTFANGNGNGSYGGAIISANNLTCSNVWFLNNFNDGNYGEGGAIASVSGGTLSLINCLFSNNVSANFGGAIYAQSCGLNLKGSTFVNNASGKHQNGTTNTSTINGGGAVYYNSIFNTMNIANTTFVSNQVMNGYGGALQAGTLSPNQANSLMVNSTLTGNSADLGGGGIEVTNSGYPIYLFNTIVSGNSGGGNVNVDAAAGLSLATNSLINGSAAAIFGTNTLANNGGLTPTIALLTTGPALDGGNSSLLPAGLSADQRGLTRVSGPAVDIGAY